MHMFHYHTTIFKGADGSSPRSVALHPLALSNSSGETPLGNVPVENIRGFFIVLVI